MQNSTEGAPYNAAPSPRPTGEDTVSIVRRGGLIGYHSPYSGVAVLYAQPLATLALDFPEWEFALVDGPTAAAAAVVRMWPHWRFRAMWRFVVSCSGCGPETAQRCVAWARRGGRAKKGGAS